jgi:PBS lyase HEAT-like repeat
MLRAISSIATRRKIHLVVCLALLTVLLRGQAGQRQLDMPPSVADSATVRDAIANIESGQFSPVDAETIAEAGATEAIPSLKEQFTRSQDLSDKMKIASVLVRLGNKEDAYWDFLIRQATAAIEDDAPFIAHLDEKGNLVTDKLSPEFLKWASDHHLDREQAEEDVLYNYPESIADLGATGDARAIPILRRALLSQNFIIQTSAARGLGEIQDKDSIPLIIEACKRAPAQVAAQIALPLVYFDDNDAQRAVDLYVPKERVVEARKARAAGEKPFGERPLRSASSTNP